MVVASLRVYVQGLCKYIPSLVGVDGIDVRVDLFLVFIARGYAEADASSALSEPKWLQSRSIDSASVPMCGAIG